MGRGSEGGGGGGGGWRKSNPLHFIKSRWQLKDVNEYLNPVFFTTGYWPANSWFFECLWFLLTTGSPKRAEVV